ncbi:APC membrane recruitment protein 1, partial [Mesitornis unicolor]
AAELQQPQPPPGKLKKTAFKLFGGKRSICTLPSFFGGRSKGQGKAASKKGLSKCKTHDGLSSAADDKGGGVQLESPSEGSRDPHPLPSSQSALLVVDSSAKFDFGRRDSSPPGSIEGCEKKPNGDKSSFPRHKKGLKGFFNSIRRHRKSKAAECEKTELPEWTGAPEEAGKAPSVGAESRGAAELILGDAASLKSFDSLTGCGDDIAEPDIAESSISVERSRDAAKRSSCLVTYQGGGEEMAIPEEAEEYLHQFWNGTTTGDGGYGAQVSSSSLETHASHEEAHPYVGDTMDGVDLLTPQSDQQESAPNSDEGYYDSTTPGPEDEGREGLGEIKKDHLPRDSYSGDALYEF